MCGIFGILGNYDQQKAINAFQTIAHRGKDNTSIIERKNLFFGHHRLSIQDLKEHANQPFAYKNLLLSFNGEIYNHTELRQELESTFHFSTQSDTEVLVAAYLKWGTAFVNHLRGMFAIALHDNDTLYLFRDRFGKKPLFYSHHKEFVFASEIKAIKPFLKSVELNNDALLSYLSFLAPTPPHTFYKNIQKLAPGEFLTYNGKTVKIQKYYSILDTPSSVITSKNDAIHRLEAMLDESMKLRLNTTVSTAALLSGGIDSATINFFAKKHNHYIPTYTVGYKEYEKYDERVDAAQTAKYLGLENKQIIISQEQFLEKLDAVLHALDEPLGDPASVPLYILFEQIAKDGHKVVLSGEGSDEIFLGYKQYFEYLDIEQLSNLKNKNWLKNYFRSHYSEYKEWEYYKRAINATPVFRSFGECFTDLQKNELLKQNIKDEQSLTYMHQYCKNFLDSKHKDQSLWYTYIDLHLFQAEHFLTKLDRMSMAHTLEARTPFLDHELVQTIFSISPELRYEDNTTKSLLKQIMRSHLHPSILQKKKKGFSNPYIEYLINAGELESILVINQQMNLFKHNKLQEYISHAKKGQFKHHVWTLYILFQWIKNNLL